MGDLQNMFDLRKGIDEGDILKIERPSMVVTSQRRLMTAVLEDAIYQLRTKGVVNRFNKLEKQDVTEWVLKDDDVYIFSFVRICEELNLDAGKVRKALLETGVDNGRYKCSNNRNG